MSQQQPPVPLPRRQFTLPDAAVDNEPVKPNSTPQSPTKYSEIQKGFPPSTPPPVSPKKWVMKSPGQSDIIVKKYSQVVAQLSQDNMTAHPTLPPALPEKQFYNKTQEANTLAYSYDETTSWSELCRDLRLRGASEEQIINVKAEKIYKAIQGYIQHLSQHGDKMQEYINDLHDIANNLDKVSKGTKIAGITGGATTVAGGVAAAAGVILSPFTLGASLALTAVGVGVAAAGGVTGASAAIAHKVSVTQDKKKIEKVLQEYEQLNENSVASLKCVDEGMEQLKQHGLSVLSNVKMYSAKVATVLKLAATGGAGAMALEANSKASGMIKGFAMGMDFYYTEGKHGPKVKKGLESVFAKKIRKLAEDLDNGLKELIKIKDLFTEQRVLF
ncbi:apolipoprotein L3-like [Parambassis ranga]|uniref:Apolipoprotein L3-like n=1 Tax=Parambassis ranga TaxID=210632 RepID=A0A6P7IZF9_9TELE|nr:apolipoprotein L3-like [Parambassis ranga]